MSEHTQGLQEEPMTTTPTIDGIVRDAVLNTLTPEYIDEQVKTHVDRLVEESIRDALRSYSDNGKAIKKAIEESLRVVDLDLPEYGHVVTSMVKDAVEARVAEVVRGKLAEDVEALLHLAPKTIKLSKIVERMLERLDHDEGDQVECELGEPGSFGSRWLRLHPEAFRYGRTTHDVRLLIGEDGTIRAGWIQGGKLGEDRGFGHFDGLEQDVRAWYACKTVIELDIDNVETQRWDD